MYDNRVQLGEKFLNDFYKKQHGVVGKRATIWDTFVLGLINFLSLVTSVDLDFIYRIKTK